MIAVPPKHAKYELIGHLIPILRDLRDMTAGAEAERWLNANIGVESPLYRDVSSLLLAGVRQGSRLMSNTPVLVTGVSSPAE